MSKKKHHRHCPNCGSVKTIKFGKEVVPTVASASFVNKHFRSITPLPKPLLWIEHIDGVPFRKLGDENNLSPAQTYARVVAELNQLPRTTG